MFKTSIDQFSGRLSFIKVYQRLVSADTELINVREGKREKLGKVYTSQGKKLEEVDELVAGDIGILAKLAPRPTNDTLAAPDRPLHYPAACSCRSPCTRWPSPPSPRRTRTS